MSVLLHNERVTNPHVGSNWESKHLPGKAPHSEDAAPGELPIKNYKTQLLNAHFNQTF